MPSDPLVSSPGVTAAGPARCPVAMCDGRLDRPAPTMCCRNPAHPPRDLAATIVAVVEDEMFTRPAIAWDGLDDDILDGLRAAMIEKVGRVLAGAVESSRN